MNKNLSSLTIHENHLHQIYEAGNQSAKEKVKNLNFLLNEEVVLSVDDSEGTSSFIFSIGERIILNAPLLKSFTQIKKEMLLFQEFNKEVNYYFCSLINYNFSRYSDRQGLFSDCEALFLSLFTNKIFAKLKEEEKDSHITNKVNQFCSLSGLSIEALDFLKNNLTDLTVLDFIVKDS